MNSPLPTPPTSGTTRWSLRPSTDDDMPAVAAIYAHAVQTGTGSFELEAPSLDEMRTRRAAVLANGLPWLVAERGGQVLGYAYAQQFRPRRAYRFCVEDSIYLHPGAQRGGVGTLLLAELMARCQRAGARQMVAVIGDSQNLGSVAVHRRCGFEHMGTMKSAGWKFGRWLDVVFMQRALGLGDSAAATDNDDTAHA